MFYCMFYLLVIAPLHRDLMIYGVYSQQSVERGSKRKRKTGVGQRRFLTARAALYYRMRQFFSPSFVRRRQHYTVEHLRR